MGHGQSQRAGNTAPPEGVDSGRQGQRFGLKKAEHPEENVVTTESIAGGWFESAQVIILLCTAVLRLVHRKIAAAHVH